MRTNNRAQVLSSQVRQVPNQKHESNEVVVTGEQGHKVNKQSQVVYTMNI